MASRRSWDQLGAGKRTQLASSIPVQWRIPSNLMPPDSQDDVTTWPETSGWFSPDELTITNLTAGELIAKLASAELKSEDVTRAFCKRAAAAHQLTNCLTAVCFDRAIATARARDEHLTRTGSTMGPLHGLPISLKDAFNLKGLDSTIGFSSYVDQPAQSDSALVQLLEEAGAVVYVKTNVPTAMMIAESVNWIFGRTLNPSNRRTTPGGSSGGESALISFKGSPLGVGTDIGGSLRIPAACTGLFTIRPSLGRFPVRDCRSSMPGQETIHSVNGPMAHTLDDVELYCRAVSGTRPWLRDAKCLPIPWREPQLPKKLKIAVMWHDGQVLPTPPVCRGLRETATKLRAAGHHIIDWDPRDQVHGLSLLRRILTTDGGLTIRRQLEKTGEPWRPEMWRYRDAEELGAAEMWELHVERTAFQNRYLDRWIEAGIDAILCPTTPYSTTKHDTFNYHAYTGVWNVLDYSAISFPTGFKVDKRLDQHDADYTPLAAKDECREVHDSYDADLVHGQPISLQLVAARLEEEKALAMTRRVLEALDAPRAKI